MIIKLPIIYFSMAKHKKGLPEENPSIFCNKSKYKQGSCMYDKSLPIPHMPPLISKKPGMFD